VPQLTPALAATCAVCWRSKTTGSSPVPKPCAACALLAEMDLRHPDAMQHNSVVSMQQQHLIVPHARIAETANLGFSN
jgi:uroporphyrinogen-III synthase